MSAKVESPAKKRKTLHDFFSPTCLSDVHPKPPATATEEGIIFSSPASPPPNQVPGLSILPDFLTQTEEAELVSFLDSQHWRTDLARRVIHYGGTYCLMPPRDCSPEERKRIENTILTAAPIPDEVNLVVDRMVDCGLYTLGSRPEYCIVNSYTDSQGISAHVENFRFDSPVCGLTLCNGDWMRFHELTTPDDGSVRSGKAARAPRTGRRVDVWLPRRSLVVMSGDAREKWQHEIVRGKKGRVGKEWRRVSLTFRVEKKENGKKTARTTR